MNDGERQVAPTLDGIRRDHVARYEWAAKIIPAGSRVIDFACGVGYGTRVLCDAGHAAFGYDIDTEAHAYAVDHYLWGKDGTKPSTFVASSSGNFMGSVTGSFFRPS